MRMVKMFTIYLLLLSYERDLWFPSTTTVYVLRFEVNTMNNNVDILKLLKRIFAQFI